ncbi:hypothetical protein HBI70_077700 [Parastagonospora nodorum]|nr:hypothetical protein HBI10_136520 [Parastagonospora nodorum]KAH4020523.1 hypothetical protein HBI13_115950 [Parastagonospora nodorum]KAH4119178.1 hypothetical protein HBH47_128720 [Parastagonospora nodorum]KAH4412710.1 hypothetical protein HBH92_099180 [Parastagonospora nodorum]KAH4427690.1 hypothetical protein HBH93_167500 [Parastagonospora nodorum]
MDARSNKRKAVPGERDKGGDNKRHKGKKQWDTGRKGVVEHRVIQPGDTGIWATCAMNKEAKSVADLRDLFQEYATKIYGPEQTNGAAADAVSDTEEEDIEAEIKKELADIRKPIIKPLFRPVKLDTQCLMFFKTRLPVEPVAFVEKICQDTAAGVQVQNCRYVKRLTPITAIEKATVKGLEAVAKKVLAPHFHGKDQIARKFAIRPSIRNNKELLRNDVIKTVAAIVGPGHKVDLRGYDLLILVEIYQNVVGMSVVGPDFEKLKRFNLEELQQQPHVNKTDSSGNAKIENHVDSSTNLKVEEHE